jgi:hypothetical protein
MPTAHAGQEKNNMIDRVKLFFPPSSGDIDAGALSTLISDPMESEVLSELQEDGSLTQAAENPRHQPGP